MKTITLNLLILFSLLVSCAHDKPKGDTEAEILYKEAQLNVDDERFILATEKLNELKNKYPYSFYAIPAELLQADILFMQENYVEASAAYLLFRDFHPRHAKIAYVVYKIAESYNNQIPDTFDRDLQGAVEAIKYYRELMSKYPASKFIGDAAKKIESAEKKLREKEKYIADFYFKTEKFQAARWRYLDIISNFKNKSLIEHSMNRVVVSSYILKEYKKCLIYGNRFQQVIKKSFSPDTVEALTKCKSQAAQ